MRLVIACLAGLSLAVPALAQEPADVDRGSFIIYMRDQAIGAETFGIEAHADSLNVGARSYRRSRMDADAPMIEKGMILSLGRSDYALRFYQANETFEGTTLIKGVVAAPDDTAFTIFREQKGMAGVAERLVAPPGRMFVLDTGVYSLFNLICLNLHGKTFTSRPITLLTLSAARDTVVEAEVADLGGETIRWGSRPVTARKLRFKEGTTEFLAWVSPAGKLLRLTHDASGLRVERDPPPVKRATPKPGG